MSQLVTIFDHGDPWTLTGVVVFVLIVAKCLTDNSGMIICAWCATMTIVAYACYRFLVRPPRNAEELFDVAIRGALSGGMALGVSRLLWPTVCFLCRYLIVRPWQSMHAPMNAPLNRVDERQPLPEPAPEPPPLPSLEERAEQIRREYDEECNAIHSLGLDSDEERIALDQARQRLMRRLREMLP